MYFPKFHAHLEENLARSFQNVFDKCSRVLNLVFSRNWIFHENHHILGYYTTLTLLILLRSSSRAFIVSIAYPSLKSFNLFCLDCGHGNRPLTFFYYFSDKVPVVFTRIDSLYSDYPTRGGELKLSLLTIKSDCTSFWDVMERSIESVPIFDL